MDTFKKIVGQNIKQARKSAGYKTQHSFAEKLETDTGTVGRWEAGIYSPSNEFWDKIVKLTGKPKIWFMGVSKDLALELARETANFAGEKRQKRLDVVSWELNLDLEDPKDKEFLDKILPILPNLKKIPPDIIDLLSRQDDFYFDHLRRMLQGLEEKKKAVPSKKKAIS